jgi:hypothetical protein
VFSGIASIPKNHILDELFSASQEPAEHSFGATKQGRSWLCEPGICMASSWQRHE